MITTILFIRHAATVANESKVYAGITDVAISEAGYKQIETLTEQLRDIKVDQIYTGPLTRTQQTIDMIARTHHITPVIEVDLIEKNLGVAENMTIEDIDKIVPGAKKRFQTQRILSDIPGEESLEKAQKRIVNCVKKIIRSNIGKTVIISSHGWVGRLLLCYITNTDIAESYKFSLKNTGIVTIQYDHIYGSFKLEENDNILSSI